MSTNDAAAAELAKRRKAERELFYKYVSIDNGASFLKVVWQLVRRSNEPDPKKARAPHLQNCRFKQIPQIMGFVQESGHWEFYWGEVLERILRLPADMRPAEADIVICKHVKLALFDNDDSPDIRRNIEEKLAVVNPDDPTIEWLLVQYFRQLRLDIDIAIKEDYRKSNKPFADWDDEDLDAMEQTTLLGVPEVSNIEHGRILTQVAKEAGFSSVVIVSETEASVTWRSLKLKILENRIPGLKV